MPFPVRFRGGDLGNFLRQLGVDPLNFLGHGFFAAPSGPIPVTLKAVKSGDNQRSQHCYHAPNL
jgi:hypothetical protein